MLLRLGEGSRHDRSAPRSAYFPGCSDVSDLAKTDPHYRETRSPRRGHQMDPVFDAQYVPVRNRSLTRTPKSRWPTRRTAGSTTSTSPTSCWPGGSTERLRSMLPGLRHVKRDERHGLGDRRLPDGLAVLSIADLREGRFTVPEILDRLEASDDYLGLHDGQPLATPVHVMHTAKLCAASEPGVPVGSPTQPTPPVKGNRGDQMGMARDFGHRPAGELLPGRLDVRRYPWLEGVDGDRRRGSARADPASWLGRHPR